VACSVQRAGLEAKIRSDLGSICGQGQPVARVAFFAVQELPVAARRRLQEEAKQTRGVSLEVFDGEAVSRMLAQGDLVWVAQRYLDLPSHLVPEASGHRPGIRQDQVDHRGVARFECHRRRHDLRLQAPAARAKVAPPPPGQIVASAARAATVASRWTSMRRSWATRGAAAIGQQA
jgi:hypothetical protein